MTDGPQDRTDRGDNFDQGGARYSAGNLGVGDEDGAEEVVGGGRGGGMPVAGLSWNCSSNLMAVCYGRMDIEGTDTQERFVHVLLMCC